jgi:hypothetical protein
MICKLFGITAKYIIPLALYELHYKVDLQFSRKIRKSFQENGQILFAIHPHFQQFFRIKYTFVNLEQNYTHYNKEEEEN